MTLGTALVTVAVTFLIYRFLRYAVGKMYSQ